MLSGKTSVRPEKEGKIQKTTEAKIKTGIINAPPTC